MESLHPRAVNLTGWPFGFDGVKEGYYRSNHTTTASIVYSPETLPVPWPWLLASIALSLIVASWGYYSTVKNKYRDEQGYSEGEDFRAKITLGFLALTTIRSIATFVLAVRVYLPSPNRYPPTAAIASLMIAAISSALDCGLLPGRYWRAVMKRIAQLNAWLSFASLIMVMVFPFTRGSFMYGQFHLEGGNCPIVVWQCPYQPNTIGCPDKSLSSAAKADYWVASYKDIYGLALFTTHLIPSELAIAVLAILVGGYITVSGFRLISWARELFEYAINFKEEKERRSRESETNTETELYFVGAVHKPEKPRPPIRKDASVFIILSILIFAFVSVPLHAVQEGLPKDTIITDAFGPPDKYYKETQGPKYREQMQKSYSGESKNRTSWLDCYTTTAPKDKFGWMGNWIEVQKSEPLTFLAFI